MIDLFFYVFYCLWGSHLLVKKETDPIPYLQLIMIVLFAILREVSS